MNKRQKDFISITLCVLLVSIFNACNVTAQEYTVELRVVRVLKQNTKDSSDFTKLFIKRIVSNDTTDIYGGIIFHFQKDFDSYIYQDKLFTTHKTYDYRGIPDSYTIDSISEAEIEKDIFFSRANIGPDTLYPAQVMWISSTDYPFLRNVDISFEDGYAIVSGNNRKFVVELATFTVTDEKGQSVIVHYPEKKR